MLNIQYTISGTQVTLTGNYPGTYDHIQFDITYPDGTKDSTFDSLGGKFYNLVDGAYTVDGIVIDRNGNPIDSGSITFTYTTPVTPLPTPTPTPTPPASTTVFTLTQQPGFLNAVNNPIILSYFKNDYKIGELFFLEVWTTDNKDVRRQTTVYSGKVLQQTLKINGDGTGNATFDISDILNSVFTSQNVQQVNPFSLFQKDESAYVGFYTKAGYITYDSQNKEVKTYVVGTDIQWACRAALPLSVSGDMFDYAWQGYGAVKYMTNITPGTRRKRSEDTLLSVFLSLEDSGTFNAKADLTFRDGSTDTVSLGDFQVNTGGQYILNAKPQFFQTHAKYAQLKSYNVYAFFTDSTGYSPQITNRQEFDVTEDVQNPVKVMFLNRLGGWDLIHFNKDYDVKMKIKGSDFTSTYNTRTYQVNSDTSITYHSGWLTQGEYQWLKDLMLSPYVCINQTYFRKEDTSFDTDTTSGLFSIDLTVSPDYEENTIKL